MSATENVWKFFPSTELEHQALMITVSNAAMEPISPQSSLSDFSQTTTSFTEFKNSLHGSKATLQDEIEVQEASVSAPSTVIHDSKIPEKTNNLHLTFPSPRKGNANFKLLLAFLTSNVTLPTLKPSSSPDLRRDDSLTYQLPTERFHALYYRISWSKNSL